MAPRLVILIIILAAVVTYGNALHGQLTGDAAAIFGDNRFYKDPANLPRLFQEDFVMTGDQMRGRPGEVSAVSGCLSYRPLTALSFFADYALWRDNARGYYFTNIVLHALVAILFFYLAAGLTASGAAGLLASLIFLVHPVQTEVVNSVGYRSDLLMALCVLAAFLGYRRYRAAPGAAPLIITAVGFLLALLAKETAVMFLPLLLGYEWLRPESLPGPPDRRRPTAALVLCGLILVLYLAMYLFFQPSEVYLNPEGGGRSFPPASIAGIIAHYVTVVVLPWAAVVVPPFYAPPSAAVPPVTVATVAALLVAALAAVPLFRRKHPLLAFGLLWIMLTFLPASNIVPLPNPMGYRFLYLPMAGVALLAALAMTRLVDILLKNKTARLMRIMAGTLTGLLVVVTLPLNEHYQNDVILPQKMIEHFPGAARPYWLLGLALQEQGRCAEATAQFQHYLAREKNNPFVDVPFADALAWRQIGLCAATPAAAEFAFRREVAVAPHQPLGYLDLARHNIRMGRFEEGLVAARAVTALDPATALGYALQIHCLTELDRPDEARAILITAQSRFPGHPHVAAAAQWLRGHGTLRPGPVGPPSADGKEEQ